MDLPLVFPVQLPALFEIQRADVLVARLDAADAGCAGVERALHVEAAALELRRRDPHEARLLAQDPRILGRQRDAPPGALAARLQARASTPDDGDVLAELLQHVLVAAAEALACRRQDDHRDHAPEDPEHRQETPELVRPKILE